MYGVYTSNHPNHTLAIPQFEFNNTDWTRINITSVEGSVVNQIYTLHFKNGSETSFNLEADVNRQNRVGVNFTEKGVPICAANLCVGDILPDEEIVIDQVVNTTYGGGIRETIHASWNNSYDWGDICFDRETGMLTLLNRTHRFTSAYSGDIVDKNDVIELTSTNRWQINQENPLTQQSPSAILIISVFGGLFGLALIGGFVFKKALNHRLAGKAANYK